MAQSIPRHQHQHRLLQRGAPERRPRSGSCSAAARACAHSGSSTSSPWPRPRANVHVGLAAAASSPRSARVPSPPTPSPRRTALAYSSTPFGPARAAAAAAAAALPPGPSGGQPTLPYSQETNRALRAAREQTVQQGFMFAGPDQILLGILAAADAAAAGRRGGAAATAARLLETALGGGDADSVREWLNEQKGVVAPLVYGRGGGGGGGGGGAVSSSRLRPSDVEFTGEAMVVLRRAQAGAEAMGSRSVGTYHLLMALMGSEQRKAEEEGLKEGQAAEAEEAEAGGVGPSGKADSDGEGGVSFGLLPALLRVAGADTAALHDQLMALAEADTEAPAGPAAAAYQDVVAHLRDTYRRQAGLPASQRDEAAFRAGPPGRGGAAGQGGGDEEAEEDPYE